MTMLQRIEKLEKKREEQRNSDMDAMCEGVGTIDETLKAITDFVNSRSDLRIEHIQIQDSPLDFPGIILKLKSNCRILNAE